MVLYSDLERYADALPYLNLAQHAARENDDPDLVALVLVCRAYLTQFSGGSPALAAEFADAAVSTSIDQAARPTTCGLAAAISSRQLAVLGDERGSRTRLDIAREAMADHQPDPAGIEVCTFDPTMVTYYESGNLVRLGRYADAMAASETALAALKPTMHRKTDMPHYSPVPKLTWGPARWTRRARTRSRLDYRSAHRVRVRRYPSASHRPDRPTHQSRSRPPALGRSISRHCRLIAVPDVGRRRELDTSDITVLRNVGGVEFTAHLPPAGSMANALTVPFNWVSVAEGWPGGKHRTRCPWSSP